MKERRYDIDWVRMVATLAVFVFHSGRFFDTLDWHLKNSQQSYFLSIFVGFLDLWMMPLLFLLSGLGSWHSLDSSHNRQGLPSDYQATEPKLTAMNGEPGLSSPMRLWKVSKIDKFDRYNSTYQYFLFD